MYEWTDLTLNIRQTVLADGNAQMVKRRHKFGFLFFSPFFLKNAATLGATHAAFRPIPEPSSV